MIFFIFSCIKEWVERLGENLTLYRVGLCVLKNEDKWKARMRIQEELVVVVFNRNSKLVVVLPVAFHPKSKH